MNNLLRGPKYSKRTVDAIFRLLQENVHPNISVKNIRRVQGVKGTDKSAVMFYGNSLTFLEREGVLKVINHSSPKKYELVDKKKLESLKASMRVKTQT